MQGCQWGAAAENMDAVCKQHSSAKREVLFAGTDQCSTASWQDVNLVTGARRWGSLKMIRLLCSNINHDVLLSSNQFNYTKAGLASR